MQTDERETLQRCFAKTKGLFMKHTMSEDWADNITNGSLELKTPLQWKHFYVWLANPNGYNEAATDALEIYNSMTNIDPYPSNMVVETFKNGTDTMVYVKNMDWHDEKTPE